MATKFKRKRLNWMRRGGKDDPLFIVTPFKRVVPDWDEMLIDDLLSLDITMINPILGAGEKSPVLRELGIEEYKSALG